MAKNPMITMPETKSHTWADSLKSENGQAHAFTESTRTDPERGQNDPRSCKTDLSALARVKSELNTWIARRKTEGRFNEDLHLASRRVLLGLSADNFSGVMRAALMRDVERLRIAASSKGDA